MNAARSQFGAAAEGQTPEEGGLLDGMVAGKAVSAKHAETALEQIGRGVEKGNVNTVAILAKTDFNSVTTITPGGGLEAKGHEQVKYEYDQEKNENIGYIPQ